MTQAELARIDLFSGLSEDGFQLLENRAAEIECTPGQALVLLDAPGAGMYVVLDGTVNVEIPGSTIELGPGEPVGELALLVPGSRRIARVRAAGPARCIGISRDVFEQLLETEPSFVRELLNVVARRFTLTRG